MQTLTSPSRAERLTTWLVSAAVFLIPPVHSGSLADPFALPKEILIMVTALLLGAIAITSFLFEDGTPGTRLPALWIALAFLLCAAAAVLPATNRGLAVRGLVHLAAQVAVFWGVSRFVRRPSGAAPILWAALASASLVALGALAQVFVPGISLRLAGVSILPPGSGGATLGGAGIAVQVLILALPAGLAAAGLSSVRGRLLAGALLGLVASAVVFIGRPEGWIIGGIAAGLLLLARLVLVALDGRRWGDLAPDLGGASLRAFLVGALVPIVLVALARSAALLPGGRPVSPLDGVSLLVPTSGDPVADRLAAARGTAALLLRHPFGVGPETWRHAFLEVAWTAVPNSPFTLSHQAMHAGNAFLEMAAETGIPGGIAFALLFLVLLAQAALAASKARDAWRPVAFACLMLLMATGLAAFLGGAFQEPAIALTFWVAAGLTHGALAAAGESEGIPRLLRPGARPSPPLVLRRRGPGYAAALVWSASAILLAWDVAGRVAASRLSLLGQSAYYSGQYQQALLAFGQPAARLSPDHLPRVLAAGAYLRLGFYDQAQREFGEALARSPYFIGAFLGRAAARQALGYYDLAEEDLQAALRLWPGNPDVHVALGKLDSARGRPDAALDAYRKALQIAPSLAEPYSLMGNIFMRRGQIDEAIEAYRICLTKNPRFPKLNVSLGEAFLKKGLPEMALRYYQAAASLDEKEVQPRLLIANTYHLLGQFCEAREALEAARDLETDTPKRKEILDLIHEVEPGCAKQLRKQARQR